MMKATIKKGDLLPVLSKVQGLTGRRTNLAITTNVLIKTTKKGLLFTQQYKTLTQFINL